MSKKLGAKTSATQQVTITTNKRKTLPSDKLNPKTIDPVSVCVNFRYNTDLNNVGSIFVIWIVLKKTVLSQTVFVLLSSGLDVRVISPAESKTNLFGLEQSFSSVFSGIH